IPNSGIGGLFALLLGAMPLSILPGLVVIAFIGVAVLNAIVLMAYFNHLKVHGMDDSFERFKIVSKVRLRPLMVTASLVSLGFLPMGLSTGAGAEVQKQLATVVIGGLITATLLTLIVLPILYYYFEKGFTSKYKGTAITVLVLLLSITGANAQTQPMDLNKAIAIGLENNKGIQASALDSEMQVQLRGTDYDMPKKQVTGTFVQIYTNDKDNYFSISQTFSPFQYGAKRKLLNENATAGEMRLGITKQEVIYNIRQSWNALLYYNELNKVLQEHNKYMQRF